LRKKQRPKRCSLLVVGGRGKWVKLAYPCPKANPIFRSKSQAYLPIVASSVRASTLHYCCNDREFAWGPIGVRDHHNDRDLVNIHGNGHAHGEGERRELEPQVLLIDAGCEWECYASDSTFSSLFSSFRVSTLSMYCIQADLRLIHPPVTRTMPVGNGGKFTEESGAIYELVLEMQKVRRFPLSIRLPH
jgi:Xaa-Pro dipeptidase